MDGCSGGDLWCFLWDVCLCLCGWVFVGGICGGGVMWCGVGGVV